jgi:hypothetical protein
VVYSGHGGDIVRARRACSPFDAMNARVGNVSPNFSSLIDFSDGGTDTTLSVDVVPLRSDGTTTEPGSRVSSPTMHSLSQGHKARWLPKWLPNGSEMILRVALGQQIRVELRWS